MKKILVLVISFLVFGIISSASADEHEIRVRSSDGHIYRALVSTQCLDGYKFAVVVSFDGVQIIQMMQSSSLEKPLQPVECVEK